MSHSYSKLIVHIVFSTKLRTPYLKDTAIRQSLHAYLAGILKKCNSPAIIINSMEDHVHILCLLSKLYSASKLLEIIKKESSKWIKTKDSSLAGFAWQAGYGIFSVSQSQVEMVKRYIASQEQHHAKLTFKEELVGMLEGYEVAYDEKYLCE